jgi:hypothetical protein
MPNGTIFSDLITIFALSFGFELPFVCTTKVSKKIWHDEITSNLLPLTYL